MIKRIYPESYEESARYLRLALKHISKYHHPFNPICYALWYEYALGRNKELIEDIDKINTDQDMSLETVSQLFIRHIADDQILFIEEKTLQLSTVLKQITERMALSTNEMDSQRHQLKNYADDLAQADSLDEMLLIADNIINEIKNVMVSNSELAKKIDLTADNINRLQEELEGARNEARTDMLSGLLNRRGLDHELTEILKALSHYQPFSLVMIDIDHFKKVNDEHGHLIGDEVIKKIGILLKTSIRENDIAARYGGEEYLLVLPRTRLQGAYALTEKIRIDLAKTKFKVKTSGKLIDPITISSGIALYKTEEAWDQTVKRADKALYLAKQSGRNKTLTENDI